MKRRAVMLIVSASLLAIAIPTECLAGRDLHELKDGQKVYLDRNVLMIQPEEPRDAKATPAKPGKYRLKGGGVIDVGERGIIIVVNKPADENIKAKIVDSKGIVVEE